MPRRKKEVGRLFSRQDIFDIRNYFDTRMEQALTLAEVARELEEKYWPASTQTLIRIGNRETYREVGVGSTERPIISNRLIGETRKPGDFARPFHRQESVPELSDEEIERRSVGVIVPELELGPDGLAKVKSPGMEGLKMLLDRSGTVLEHINPKPVPLSPLEGGDGESKASEESPMELLARKAREETK